jgi:hypothetical protein
MRILACENSNLMKLTNIFSFFALLILSACSTTQAGFRDENILLNLPIPESGWAFGSGKKNGDDVEVWAKEREWLRVDILHGRGRQMPEQFQSGVDEAARKNLTKDFESTALKKGFVNNYPMILWQTSATLNNGSKIFSLFLYIEGNDAGYWVNRRWLNLSVSQTDKELWVKYLSSISVCDSRSAEHPCPIREGTRPVNYSDMTNAVPK